MPDDRPLSQEQSHHPREFAAFTYAYPVISRRSGGVSIGVNLNLDKQCNFACPYCQVDRTESRSRQPIDTDTVGREVAALLDSVDAGGICRLPKFSGLPDDSKRLKDLAISGDGEPTMEPAFPKVCARLAELQAERPDLDFKLVLITNATLLDRAATLQGVGSLLSRRGEVWAKLDAGSEEWFQKINVTRFTLDQIESNLKSLGKRHPYAIQSMFHKVDGEAPSATEVDAYLDRLRRIRDAGSRILDVQLYTLARKPAQDSCTPVDSGFLTALRGRIDSELGIPATVYGVAA